MQEPSDYSPLDDMTTEEFDAVMSHVSYYSVEDQHRDWLKFLDESVSERWVDEQEEALLREKEQSYIINGFGEPMSPAELAECGCSCHTEYQADDRRPWAPPSIARCAPIESFLFGWVLDFVADVDFDDELPF